MGICSSTGAVQVSTAKVVLPDGDLMEYSYPVRVSYVLQKHSSCFICNADEMDFDDVVSAVEEDEMLHPGQLYFALPTSWLRRPLQAEEMAALAVKASSALMKSAGDKCAYRKNSVSPVGFFRRRGEDTAERWRWEEGKGGEREKILGDVECDSGIIRRGVVWGF